MKARLHKYVSREEKLKNQKSKVPNPETQTIIRRLKKRAQREKKTKKRKTVNNV